MSISVQAVTKRFREPQSNKSLPVLSSVSLEVGQREIVSLFAPNGSGKTTLFDIIAELLEPDGGQVKLVNPYPGRPILGYLLQSFRDTLMPWQSALENVAFPLRAEGLPRRAATERALAFLDQYGFSFPRHNYPYQLSGGQQQTVSLARVLVNRPSNLLLDEPFGALDHKTRFYMRDLLCRVTDSQDLSVLLVSHDIDETLYLSDRVVMLSQRPARIIRVVDVDFMRPRTRDLLLTREFGDLRQEMLGAFLAEVYVS
jgi:NitT/TauT family transport system ATP-binding protein